jgi:flagellar motor switch protein FliN
MADSTSEKPVESAAAPEAAAVEHPTSQPAEVIEGIEAELNKLPTYARALVRIRVPVQVTLASQRKSIQEIIELGPGSIVKFDKTCGEPLELCVGDRPIAQGEVVKVGDKFGLKISGLVK